MYKWENLTSNEIGKLDKKKSLVILPLASIEQHGPHLPVGTDTIILQSLIDKIIREIDIEGYNIVFAPLLQVGKSNEHIGFPGTITFSTTTYYSLIFDIAKSIALSGFKKLLLFNSHGGNTDMLNMISRDLRIELGIEVFVFDWWFTPFWSEALEELKESGKYGVFHACELETSLMLNARPETVHMELAVDEDPNKNLDNYNYTILGPYITGWKTSDVTKSGIIGAPSYATAEKGKKFYEYAVKKLRDILVEIANIEYINTNTQQSI